MNPRRLIRQLQSILPPATQGATVLAYHLVEGGTRSVVDLPRSSFLNQMELLKAGYDVIPLRDLNPKGSPRQVVLTFDDAYENFYDTIWPILQRYAFPATLYVPTGFIEGTSPPPIRETELSACTWEQLKRMSADGLEIGSHTCSHPDLKTLAEPELRHEVLQSKRILEDKTGTDVTSFCYPRGLQAPKARALVEAVYTSATIGGGQRINSPRVHLERTSIRRDHTIQDFRNLLDCSTWLEEALSDHVRQIRR